MRCLDKGGWVSPTYKQAGQVLDLEFLFPPVQASKAAELKVGNDPFGGRRMEEKLEVGVWVRSFEEDEGGERMGGKVNGERDT